MSDAHAGNPSSPTIDTRPSSQEPPDSLAVSARQALPAVLNDAPFNGAAADYSALRQRLETKGHGRDAAEWAIHWHVQAGHLIAEPGYTGAPGVWNPGGRVLRGGTYRSFQRDDCRLQATPALWAWWRDSDKPTPSPNRLSAIADALAAEKARLDPIRRRFDEWDATCAQAANELRHALLAMFDSEIETRRTPDGVNPRLWVPHLLNAGRILRERGWIDLIDGRLSDAGYDRCGYAMLHETANGMSAATLGDEIDRLFAAGAFDQFTWQYVLNFVSGALRGRHLEDWRRLYPELWPSSADQIGPALTRPQPPEPVAEPASAPQAAGAKQSEGEPPAAKPDGPFGANGFRFAGVEVKFGRAVLQYRLVLALWDAKSNQPAEARPVEEVIQEVWGKENDTTEPAFRQLCADTRRRFQAANCPLDIDNEGGIVHLFRS